MDQVHEPRLSALEGIQFEGIRYTPYISYTPIYSPILNMYIYISMYISRIHLIGECECRWRFTVYVRFIFALVSVTRPFWFLVFSVGVLSFGEDKLAPLVKLSRIAITRVVSASSQELPNHLEMAWVTMRMNLGNGNSHISCQISPNEYFFKHA